MSVGVALLEANRELHNVVIDLLFLLHSVTDSSAGMHYCGVIASAKDLANIHQAHTDTWRSDEEQPRFWFVIYRQDPQTSGGSTSPPD